MYQVSLDHLINEIIDLFFISENLVETLDFLQYFHAITLRTDFRALGTFQKPIVKAQNVLNNRVFSSIETSRSVECHL